MKRSILLAFGMLALPVAARAHCPLCTAGAGAAAIGAAWLGVGQAAIGIFVGAFGYAIGFMIARAIKKQFIPHQTHLIAIASAVLTVVPLLPLMHDVTSFYLHVGGSYGAWSNRVYLVNLFLVGGVIGTVLVHVAPRMSSALRRWRGKQMPYQGVIMTLALLAAAAGVSELIL